MGQELLENVLKLPNMITTLRNEEDVYQHEILPPFLGLNTQQHSSNMASFLNSYTASEVEKLSGDVNAPPTNMPFHLGGQPFWGVDLSTGKYTGIKGYELLLRYAGTNPMKLHVTASKSLFSSISPAL